MNELDRQHQEHLDSISGVNEITPEDVGNDNEFNEDQSFKEGWCASTCVGSTYFPDGWVAIQRLDEAGVFSTDWDALAFVAKRATEGSQYHRSAFEFVEQRNFDLINKGWDKYISLRDSV